MPRISLVSAFVVGRQSLDNESSIMQFAILRMKFMLVCNTQR